MKVAVANVPSYGENTVAEHTFALILALSRHVHKSYLRVTQGNLSREGLFINTPFGPDVGTRLELRLGIDSTGEEHLIPVEVVTNNIGPDYSTASIGMGVRILDVSDDLRKVIDDLYESTGLRA